MNDQLLIDNYLLILKSTVEVYVHGTLESSNTSVRNILKENLNEIMSCQAKTYDEMTKHGWYPVNNIATGEITKILNKVTNEI